MVAHPSTWELDTRESEGSHHWLYSEFEEAILDYVRPCLREKQKQGVEDLALDERLQVQGLGIGPRHQKQGQNHKKDTPPQKKGNSKKKSTFPNRLGTPISMPDINTHRSFALLARNEFSFLGPVGESRLALWRARGSFTKQFFLLRTSILTQGTLGQNK